MSIWPDVFEKGFTSDTSPKHLKASLLTMQGNLLSGETPPEKFGEGCVFLVKHLGEKVMQDAMKEVSNILTKGS